MKLSIDWFNPPSFFMGISCNINSFPPSQPEKCDKTHSQPGFRNVSRRFWRLIRMKASRTWRTGCWLLKLKVNTWKQPWEKLHFRLRQIMIETISMGIFWETSRTHHVFQLRVSDQNPGAAHAMLNPCTPKSQCFSAHFSKSVLGGLTFSSIEANTPQVTLTLNIGGEGVVSDRTGLKISSIYSRVSGGCSPKCDSDRFWFWCFWHIPIICHPCARVEHDTKINCRWSSPISCVWKSSTELHPLANDHSSPLK